MVLTPYRRVIALCAAAESAVGAAAEDDPSSSCESNSTGTRGENEERIEELRLSRSRLSRSRVPDLGLVDEWRGELPFSMWDGIAEGFRPGGDPEPMM